jgi:hypothetical protein
MTRKQALTTLAVISIVSVSFCFFLLPPIFPAVPPPEFHKIKVGMPINDVRPLFKQPPTVIDDKKENDPLAIPGPIWMFWHVHDGAIGVRLDDQERIDDVVFQASRSSVVEHLRGFWELRRFLNH